jgi:hypothetical protein
LRSFDAPHLSSGLLRISPAGSRFAQACIAAQLRIWRRKAWGFESPLSHQASCTEDREIWDSDRELRAAWDLAVTSGPGRFTSIPNRHSLAAGKLRTARRRTISRKESSSD